MNARLPISANHRAMSAMASSVTSVYGAGISVVALALIVAPSMIASVYGEGITIAAFEYLNAFLAIKGSYVTII